MVLFFVPDAAATANIRRLVERLLQPLRDRLGEPITILSGYRSDELNRLVGGVPSSQHRLGEAADCYCAAGPDHLLKVLKAEFGSKQRELGRVLDSIDQNYWINRIVAALEILIDRWL